MNKRVVFREMDSSVALEKYADEHLEKITTFLKNERDPIYIDLSLEAGRPHAHHRVELRIKTPRYDLIVHEEGAEIYKVLDSVIDRMYYQLHKEKEALIDKDRKADSYKGV